MYVYIYVCIMIYIYIYIHMLDTHLDGCVASAALSVLHILTSTARDTHLDSLLLLPAAAILCLDIECTLSIRQYADEREGKGRTPVCTFVPVSEYFCSSKASALLTHLLDACTPSVYQQQPRQRRLEKKKEN